VPVNANDYKMEASAPFAKWQFSLHKWNMKKATNFEKLLRTKQDRGV